jgi:hypothetical protein
MEYASGAEYYFAGGGISTPEEQLEWMINQGTDIINISMGYSPRDQYSDFSRWVDHIGYQHSILITKSSGNGAGYGVTTPGMAYNVITVGGVINNNGGYIRNDGSCYYNGYTLASKPDISALGPYGTSEAAPRVAGVAAQILQARPALIAYPETVKAILTASVDKSTFHYTPDYRYSNIQSYMQVGAGVLSLRNATDIATMSNTTAGGMISSTFTTSNTNATWNLSVDSSNIGKCLSISLSFYNPVLSSGTHSSSSSNATSYGLANIDLYVYLPNSTTPYRISTSTNNNVEMVNFEIPVSGIYRIEVIQTTAANSYVFYGLAWHYYE